MESHVAATIHFSTKDRILGAAEELFAQFGFAGTSLRQVTSRADVNIAAVNYHFGSKENLVNEVFRRRMDEMSALRLAQLHAAVAQPSFDLERILAAFVAPALAMAQDRAKVLEAGFEDYLVKPIEPQKVIEAIRLCLRRS